MVLCDINNGSLWVVDQIGKESEKVSFRTLYSATIKAV